MLHKKNKMQTEQRINLALTNDNSLKQTFNDPEQGTC